MHDPLTVAWQVPNPFARPYDWKSSRWRDRPALVTIWHVDPERDGSDDSCGWSYPRASEADLAWARAEAGREWDLWFGDRYAACNLHRGGDLSVLTAAWTTARRHATGKNCRSGLTAWEVSEILDLVSNPVDNLLAACRGARESAKDFEHLLLSALRCYRRAARPWWRHPRYHVWHWRLQVHFLQSLRRRLFTRCLSCGGRFKVGDGVCTSSGWECAPRRWFEWFRSEPDVMHARCSNRILMTDLPDEVPR